MTAAAWSIPMLAMAGDPVAGPDDGSVEGRVIATAIGLLCMLAVGAPLAGSLAAAFSRRSKTDPEAVSAATGSVAISFALSLTASVLFLVGFDLDRALLWEVPWIPLGGGEYLHLGLLIDGLSLTMLCVVSGVSMLVHFYSTGYMQDDPQRTRFFAYLALFAFAMMGIVASSNLLQIFIFWELVGLSSYLLIGFWHERASARAACVKAFVMNRIGDVGFIVGLGVLIHALGGNLLLPGAETSTAGEGRSILTGLAAALDAQGHTLEQPPVWLTLAGVGFALGAMGKSAQFPLHTWLPDAMEGPTPVSSLLHSATMVAAGVYLLGRVFPILTPEVHLFLAVVGLFTLSAGALMACVARDIKRVLAYSTVSQLGYMVLGLGVGAWGYAMLHLVFHAFFKCGLFQCSGSIIHAMHHRQDMADYGGLRGKLPVTHVCFLVCGLALAGATLPLVMLGEAPIGFSGAYSKDGILAGAVAYGEALRVLGYGMADVFWILPLVTAYLTAFYITRAYALTFWGRPRQPELYEHAHEAPRNMRMPQITLATLAVVAGLLPFGMMLDGGRSSFEAAAAIGHEAKHQVHVWLLNGFGWVLAAAAAFLLYRDGFGFAGRLARMPVVSVVHRWLQGRLYLDLLYDVVVVNFTTGVARVFAAADRSGVDGVVRLSAPLTKGLAALSGAIDLAVVDKLVHGPAQLAERLAWLIRGLQGGRIRVYVLSVFAFAAAVTLLLLGIWAGLEQP